MKKKDWKPFYDSSRVLSQKATQQYEAFEGYDDAHKRFEFFRSYIQPNARVQRIIVEGPVMMFYDNVYEWKYGSGRFYKASTLERSFYVNRETGKFYMTGNCASAILLILDFSFLNEVPNKCLTKSVLKNVLLGKFTNPEQVVKAYLKSVKCADFPWKASMKLMKSGSALSSICSVKELLVNPISFLNCISDIQCGDSYYVYSLFNCEDYLIRDLIVQARILNRKIDHRWSAKRIQETHNAWTQEIMKYEIGLKESRPIWNTIFEETLSIEGFELLNNEMRTFQEGSEMHHCIYTNYWRKIKNKTYIGLSCIINNERVTVGINLCDNDIRIQQAYKKYDESLTKEERDTLDKRFEEITYILSTMKESAKKSIKPAQPSNIVIDENLPW